MSTQRPSVLASSKWILVGTVAAKPIQLLGNVLLAHLLGPLGMGTFGLASSSAVTLSGLVGMGLGDAANKLLAEHYRRDPDKGRAFGATIFWFTITNSLVVLTTMWFFQSYWVHLIFPNGSSKSVLALSLALAWANILASLSTSIFNGIQHFKSISLLSAAQAVICVILAPSLAYFGGAEGALAGYVISTLVYVFIAAIRLSLIDSLFLRFPFSEFISVVRGAMRCSAPFWMSALLIGPITTLSFAFLAKQENGQAELGVFNTANTLKMLIATLPGIMGPVLMAAIIEEGGAKGNEDAYFLLFRRSLIAITFLSIPMLVITCFSSESIFLVYGPVYSEAAGMFQPLSAGIALSLIASVAQFSLVAKGQVWGTFLLGSLQQILMYTFAILLVPRYLGLGLAWSNFLSSFVGTILLYELASFVGAAPPQSRKMYYAYIAAITSLLFLACLAPAHIRLFLVVPVTLLCVFGFLYRYSELRLWLMSVLPKRQIEWLKALNMRIEKR